MSEDVSRLKRKPKTEEGPDKKQKLEASGQTTFEVQPEVEVVLLLFCVFFLVLTFSRTSSGKHYGARCKTTSAGLPKVKTN